MMNTPYISSVSCSAELPIDSWICVWDEIWSIWEIYCQWHSMLILHGDTWRSSTNFFACVALLSEDSPESSEFMKCLAKSLLLHIQNHRNCRHTLKEIVVTLESGAVDWNCSHSSMQWSYLLQGRVLVSVAHLSTSRTVWMIENFAVVVVVAWFLVWLLM